MTYSHTIRGQFKAPNNKNRSSKYHTKYIQITNKINYSPTISGQFKHQKKKTYQVSIKPNIFRFKLQTKKKQNSRAVGHQFKKTII